MPKVKSRKYRRRRGGNPGESAVKTNNVKSADEPVNSTVETGKSTGEPGNSTGKPVFRKLHIDAEVTNNGASGNQDIPTVTAELVEGSEREKPEIPTAVRVESSAAPSAASAAPSAAPSAPKLEDIESDEIEQSRKQSLTEKQPGASAGGVDQVPAASVPEAARVEPAAQQAQPQTEVKGGYRKSRKSRRKKGKSRKRKMKSRRYKR